ncbi:protein C10-like [Limulus polyphemus]|uniref:Protein C10 n=1 Tax=Limulus polyphemus TaxID=6850 RepID=A0ABM1BF85_LIMPO|nr:protein C10-like [Limulus polyphemus]
MAAVLEDKEFTAEKAKVILEEILAAFNLPDNINRLDEARDNAGNDMLKHMQLVFPVATQIEIEVIQNYGFPSNGEGLIQFAQMVRTLEQNHQEIERLNAELRTYFIPPMVPPSPPQNSSG